MNYKLLGCMALLIMILIFPVSASLVSFLIVETGLNEDIPSTQYGMLWEGGLMAGFFDSGRIVTNGPMTRMEEKPAKDLSGAIRFDFDDAVRGGADYFILCVLDHRLQGRRAIPVDITIRAYRTDTRELIFEQSFPVGRGRNQNEEFQNAQSAGREIVSHIRNR